MTKLEFLKSLKTELELNQIQNVQDIMTDYEEHFAHGLRNNKTEAEIAESLGNPVSIAKAYQTEVLIKEIKNQKSKFHLGKALNIIARLLVLAPFNFFFLFIPGIVIFALLIAGWSVAIAIGSASIGVLWALPTFDTLTLSWWLGLAGVSASLAFLGMGVLSCMIMFIITKYILLGLISYLQWNLNFVTEK